MSKYVKIFAKFKHDVGKTKMEPQKVYLTSELPTSFRAYRNSPKEKAKIKELVKNLIKENCTPYSAPVTLALKREEGKKTDNFIDF